MTRIAGCQRWLAESSTTICEAPASLATPAGNALPAMQSLLRGLSARGAAGVNAGALGNSAVQRQVSTQFRVASVRARLPLKSMSLLCSPRHTDRRVWGPSLVIR